VRCPRCRSETPEPVPSFCHACGAPLLLRDDPAPGALGASLSLDRRGGGRPASATAAQALAAAPPASPAAALRPAPLAAPRTPDGDRSRWELGVVGAPPHPEPSLDTGAARPEAHPLPDADVEALEVHLRRPASWRRAAAGALDVLPFAVAGLALTRSLVRAATVDLPAPATGLDGLLDLLARERVIALSVAAAAALALMVYATLGHALAGATLGKRLLGLRVVGPDGARPSLARSAARSALAAVSAALLGLGVLLALFTRSGRALHDLLARTWVVESP
jgi:uncharacterized RDD family membrane protein YckC